MTREEVLSRHPRLATYDGYLKPYIELIVELLLAGTNNRAEIAEQLVAAGARCCPLMDKDQPWWPPDNQRLILAMLYYLLRDPKGPPTRPDLRNKWLDVHRHRPLDMGGERDVWHTWDVIAQHREFSRRDWLVP